MTIIMIQRSECFGFREIGKVVRDLQIQEVHQFLRGTWWVSRLSTVDRSCVDRVGVDPVDGVMVKYCLVGM